MTSVTLYDVLGVRPTATTAEIRAAYLVSARTAHPDVAGAGGEDRMRDVNAAWSVLGDDEARRLYDLTLTAPGPGSTAGAASPSNPSPSRPSPSTSKVSRPQDRPFVPYHAVDEDDDDEWRYADDTTDPATAPGAGLQFTPILTVLGGVLLLIAGLVLRAAPIAAVGGVVILLGLVAFLLVPLAVMAKASAAEQRRERERGPKSQSGR